MFRILGITVLALSLIGCATTSRQVNCEFGGKDFCMTTRPDQFGVEKRLQQYSTLFKVRIQNTDYFIFEGFRSLVVARDRKNFKPFTRSSVKAEYTVFYARDYQQVLIRYRRAGRDREMHIWLDERGRNPKAIERILNSFRIY